MDYEVDPILHLIPKEQLNAVFAQDCDIDIEFLGFTAIYQSLAAIIPKHWTVLDLGCAFAPQAWLFKDHAAYIGVDMGDRVRFHAPNTIHYTMTIREFIETKSQELARESTFAICSYVPPWVDDNRKLVRENFTNVFVYYPCRTKTDFPAIGGLSKLSA